METGIEGWGCGYGRKCRRFDNENWFRAAQWIDSMGKDMWGWMKRVYHTFFSHGDGGLKLYCGGFGVLSRKMKVAL